METAEVEKSTGSEEPQLNRNRSFKSKQLVRSQAIRETHSPPRALSPAQRIAPTVTITNTVGSSPPTNSANSVSNNAVNVANSTSNPSNNGISPANNTSNVGISMANNSHSVGNQSANNSSNVVVAPANSGSNIVVPPANVNPNVGISPANSGPNVGSSTAKNNPSIGISVTNISHSIRNAPANNSPGVGNSPSNTIPNVGVSTANSGPSVENPPTNVGMSPAKVGSSAVGSSANNNSSVGVSPANSGFTNKVNDVRTVSVNVSEDSSHVSVRCSDVANSSVVKHSDSDDFKKKLPVEIQITSGSWDEPYHDRQRTRRWHSDATRDLLSNNPRVCCVCGSCAACNHCRGRRRRHYCPTKQDSGIVCSDDCADCSDNDTGGSNNNDTIRKSSSLDVDDQPYYCRCPERKERPKNMLLSRNDSDDRYEPTGPELVAFIKDTLNKNVRDRMALLKIERELHALVNDTGRCIVRFPVMTSYGRMLVHRCAALFQLSHHLDQSNKTCVLVSKSGTSGGRIPCTSFKEWCTATFPPSPQRHQPEASHAKSILKRDTHSLDEPGNGSLSSNRSKSLEQREKEYERVRRRIFSSQDEAQWPWIATGPIKLLTPEGGRNKLLKVQSLEGNGAAPPSWRGARGPVSKSHSFGGYAAAEPHTPRLLSRQGDLASSSWRLSPSSSGYKTLSLRSTDSITPSPTGGASPEPAVTVNVPPASNENACVVWAVTDMSAVPPGAMVIHPQTGRPLTNPDGTVYQFDPANPPVLYDPDIPQNDQQKLDPSNEKRRGRLEKQHSFIDNECECQPSEDCRNKCCCECRRHEGCQQQQQKINTEKETNITAKPSSPNITNEINTQTNAQEPTNQPPAFEQPTNQQPEQFEPATQQQVYEQANQKTFESQRSFEPANQNAVNNGLNGRPVKLANEGQDMQYQQYGQGYRPEEVTSPPQMMNHYMPHEVNMQVMPQTKMPLPLPDPNIRPMSLTNMTNMVYPTAMAPYPYQCRVEPSLQMYQPVLQVEEQKLAPSPHNDTAFRIDPSYPYAAMDYPAACGACVDTSSLQHQQRSYSVPYGQVEVPQTVMPQYPVGNMMLAQPHLQPYPQYQEQIPWALPSHGVAAPKLMVPEIYPIMQYPQPTYPHYNIVYPQVIPQPYPICQPVYPVIEKTPEQRRNSFNSNRPSKRNSLSNSARNTPLQEEKVPFEEKPAINRQNSEIADKIQQIKNQMAQLNTKDSRFDKEKKRDEWRRRNSGSGLLGNCPVNSFNARVMGFDNEKKRDEWRRNSGSGLLGNCPVNSFNARVMGRGTSDDGHLSSAARAIVNSIRNMQAKNTYQDTRRDYQRDYNKQDRPDFRRRYDKDDKHDKNAPTPSDGQTERYDRRGVNVPVYRQPYLFRQMSPGTWCRRSPGPVHPVLNHPRRPHPDTRNPRR